MTVRQSHVMLESPVLLSRQGAVAVVRLNRPQVENAINDDSMAAFERHLDAIEGDATLRVIVLTAADTKTFCAGGDLRYFATLRARAEGVAMSERMQTILRRFANGPRPVIAAINGNAWGGGCEVLVACHLRLAAAHARFGFRQAAMGVVPGWGGGARLFRLVGRSHALRLLLTADTIDADEAQRLGLVDVTVASDRLEAEALDWASRIAHHPPEAIAAMLELARIVDHTSPAAVPALETALFGDCWQGSRFQSKLSAWSRPASPKT